MKDFHCFMARIYFFNVIFHNPFFFCIFALCHNLQ